MQEVKHYKVKKLPLVPNPNSVYYVKLTSQSEVETYITDQNGQPFPLIDLSGDTGSVKSVTGVGVDNTDPLNPIVNILADTINDITSDLEVGGIVPQQTIEAGTNLQEFVEKLLLKTFYPVLNPPSFSLTNNAGLREIGSSSAITLSFNFDRGSIVGKTDSGVWQPSLSQGFRAGASTSYTIDGTTQSGSTLTITPTLSESGNQFDGTVTYGAGTQPKDSKNINYDTALTGGTSDSQSTTVQGIYPYFYYKSNSPITASEMQTAIFSGDAEKVLGDSNGTLSIPYNVTGQYMAVAYPNTSTAKTKYFVTVLDAGALGLTTSPFNLGTVLPCDSPNSFWSNISYRIHVSPLLTNSNSIIELRNP